MSLTFSRTKVALVSLLFTYVFFFEYVRPFRSVHVPNDLEDYHYPLANYAFQAVKQGRFPQWDPSNYCGMSFVANIQAGLFYPPTWLMFGTRWNHERLSFQAVENLVFAHVWLAFFLCYLWLQGKRLDKLACILGAGVFAFSGYMCTQLEHLGVAAGYAWMPLGLWSIDEAIERRSWRPFWKFAVASGMCFLAGYPPTWFVFMVVAGAYALAGEWRWKATLGVAASAAVSLALAAVQILPTAEATGFRDPELRYAGARQPVLFLAFTLPNYIDFTMETPGPENPWADYFYLGLPALVAIPLLIRRHDLRRIVPVAAIVLASIIVLTNPFNVAGFVIYRSNLLQDISRAQYFLAGIPLAFAAFAAFGLDDFLRRKSRPAPAWLTWTTGGCAGLWAVVDIVRWAGPGFPNGWWSLLDLAAAVSIFGAGLYVARAQSGSARVWAAAALVLFVGVDYKVFGTSRRFNAAPGLGQEYSSKSHVAMDNEAYRELVAHPHDRILLDQTGPMPARIRHIGLMTPQGFDPFFTTQFRNLMQPLATFRTERDFDVNLKDDAALQLLGVRYVISSGGGPWHSQLVSDPRFRLVGSDEYFYHVFEYVRSRPPYGWESQDTSGQVSRREWTPEERTFTVRSARGGRLTFSEQFYPGWTVTIDGKRAALERWKGAFQAVQVPGGEHTVIFRFRQQWLGVGGGISLLTLIGLVFWAIFDKRERLSRQITGRVSPGILARS